MASATTLSFEKAIEYMDPTQVTDCLHKTLDFLQRNNNELYFPSISPYVEVFLVNLVSDTRNLKSKSFKYENKKFASEIIEVLEMSRDVFRWTHSYENGNLLVYKKIFSNKIKKTPAKPSSIAHRLLQAQTQQSTPNIHHASPQKAPNTGRHAPESTNQPPDIPVTSTGFKLRFLNKTLAFIKNETEFTLFNEMPLSQAEYICSLIKNRDKDVGFGYKSLYAPLWEAMEAYSVDYEFEVTLKESSRSDTKVLMLEKVPKIKSKKDKATKKEDKSINNTNGQTQKEDVAKNTRRKRMQDSNNQAHDQSLNVMPPAFPPLELLTNISERFFKQAVVVLTEFADDETRASVVLHQLADEEITFVKRVKTLAECSKVRAMFSPQYRDLLLRLDSSIKRVLQTCKITTTVNEKDRSITLKKTPRFATPLPVSAVTQQSVATRGARSKSLASTKTRDRSISKDRLIQFQKGGNVESSADVAVKEKQPERARSRDGTSSRKARLLEDLATPLESDRGMRMMLLMGWNGGALGARGDGIMEPLMPAIDLPSRGGLGHVPPPKPSKPPKVTPRRPLHFRLTFLQSMYDLLLHGEDQKKIQFKDPLGEKERKFIQSALGTLNKRHSLGLTEMESELVGLVAGELAGRPGLEVRPEYSKDLRTLTLLKFTNQPAGTPKLSAARPLAVKSSDVITITDDDADVLVTGCEVTSIMPYVDVSGLKIASKKTLRKRAVRLLFLVKLTEALHWDYQSRIVFKFDIPVTKRLKCFMRSVVDNLNRGGWHGNLLGWETVVYADLQGIAWGEQLALEALPGSKFVFTRTPINTADSLPNAAPKPRDNNNDDKTDNRNQITNVNDCTKKIDVDKDNSKKENVVENNIDSQRFIEAIVETTSNLKDAISNSDLNNKDGHLSRNSNDGEIVTQEINDAGAIVHNIQHNITDNVNIKDINLIKIEVRDNVKDINLIKIEVDSFIPTEIENTEGVEVKMETECDTSEPDVESEDEVKNGVTESEPKIKVRDILELSDWDRDIQDLEMSILKADLNFVLKEENNTDFDLELAISETDVNIIQNEKDIDYLNTKRSHTSSVCSQEQDPKKVKISSETDEHVVIIRPTIQDEKITEELVKQVQTLMANELDRAGGFLPLLKCHGVQNGGLVYSCHDEDDVAWLKNVVSDANFEVKPVLNDVCLDKKSRELLIRINSSIPLDARKIFRKFEIYNVGLDTKYWKVSHKHTGTTFIMFMVTVDEKSFKYICDEKFLLYCGIDKAQFSIIY